MNKYFFIYKIPIIIKYINTKESDRTLAFASAGKRTKAFSLRAVPKYSVDCLECIEIFERIEKKLQTELKGLYNQFLTC